MRTNENQAPRRAMTIAARRFLALAVAVLTVAGVVTIATPRPASAATPRPASAVTQRPAVAAQPDAVCLTNADSYCLSLGPHEIAIIVHTVGELIKIILERKGNDKQGDEEDELTDRDNPNLCLTDTGLSPGADASWGPCGANGTVWIWVPHTDGFYLYSRFSVDHGSGLVLTVNPLSNGAPVFVSNPAQPGGADWQTFTYFFTLTGGTQARGPHV